METRCVFVYMNQIPLLGTKIPTSSKIKSEKNKLIMLVCKNSTRIPWTSCFHNVLLKEQKSKKSQLRKEYSTFGVVLHVNPPHRKVIKNPNDHLHGKPTKGTNNICAIIEREEEEKKIGNPTTTNWQAKWSYAWKNTKKLEPIICAMIEEEATTVSGS